MGGGLGQQGRHVPQRVADLPQRKEPKLDLETKHTYDAPGEYTVVVKVIDILGNDTTKTVKVKVK